MKLLLTVFLCFLVTLTSIPTTANGCFEVERDALLTFKAGLHDPGNLLSSWHGPECCNWTGVICHNVHQHVVKLNLRNPLDPADNYFDWESHALTGTLNPALLSLKYLTHLDISGHDFSNINFPKFACSFEHLVYLNLSGSQFQGVIPQEIGNLSRLQSLDLSGSNFTGLIPPQIGNLSNLWYLSLGYSYLFSKPSVDRLSCLSRLFNLRYLDMSGIDLNDRVDWSVINQMHLLETLMLRYCSLSEIPIELSHVNLTSLKKLDISLNSFNAPLPNWLWNLTGLLYIDLRYSEFYGSVPITLSNLASLNFLGLGENNFENVFLEPISQLVNLRSLYLSWLGIGGDVLNLIKKLGNMWYNLEDVDLGGNGLTGNISWITQMRNLSIIDLTSNSLSGHIPSEIGTLVCLKELYLSGNSLSGVITEAHFVKLSNLETLDLSGNMLTLKLNENWVPPFQLQYLALESCKVGPKFPSWLQWQTQLFDVYLSNTSIIGVLPAWFWNVSVEFVDMSYNNITGNLPVSILLSKIRGLNLRSNNISGPMPSVWGRIESLDLSNNILNGSIPTKFEFPQARLVELSGNKIDGAIPQGVCNMSYLIVLQLSHNAISGEIPDCWKNISNLEAIDLSNNQITGELPASIGSLQNLVTLQLYNNKLHGEIPSTLQQCKNLVFLSLGMNNFSGKIPAWLGKQLQNLVVLQLRSNKFTGFIPPEIGELANLQILDLAHNSLVGSIPNSVGNFSSMKNSSQYYLTMYGVYTSSYSDTLYININGQYVYSSAPLEFVKTIDISGNNLSGQVPEEIWLLQAVMSLNLSRNSLIGEISETIDGMRNLESLDLSFNEMSGQIPHAMSTLFSLHNLNLSYNNFSGKIPNGRQLDTLNDSSIYVGNSYLCGPPTDKSCSNGSSIGIDSGHGENGREMIWVYLSVALGFVLGFWSIWGVLIYQNIWWVAYFGTIDNLFDKMYVQIVLARRRLICSSA
ncbi:LRR receptor-like serine/threonine-protein kinase GSO1 [Rhynchospora pubera]|uniref:LRR receptor-like serine/threonine-protein kinase GSO1 n=1 Tax=Rhynchospora pubera TaxID=906938 RepID=A0AAV8F5F7_9POAL|nr:LRR receptor-like serine/threonine-protein kinase GSO1 [Rhynchospora pubera]